MILLRIDDVARMRRLSISEIVRRTDIPLSSVRRYYYSSKTGLSRDRGTITAVNLLHLERIADLLDVPAGSLLIRAGDPE